MNRVRILPLLMLIVVAITGCTIGTATPEQDPFAAHSHCVNGQCTPCYDVHNAPPEEHSNAIEEVKDAAPPCAVGNCVTCPNGKCGPIPQPSTYQPCPAMPSILQLPSNVQTPVDPNEVPREGAFACIGCGRKTVGAEFHELWADDGTSLMCLCQQCWRSMTPTQKRQSLEAFVGKSDLTSDQRHYARQAILEATAK